MKSKAKAVSLGVSIRALAAQLKKEAAQCLRVAAHGSPVTSMAEDRQLGEVGREKLRIARRLYRLLRIAQKIYQKQVEEYEIMARGLSAPDPETRQRAIAKLFTETRDEKILERKGRSGK